MKGQSIELKQVSREDVQRIQEWLQDPEVSDSWFGRYSYGDPAHLGYHPERVVDVSDVEWQRIFEDPEHRILSVYTKEDDHIGEIHVAIEESLGDGQVSILIGRKDLWHRGFGTSAIRATLDEAFNEWGLFRVWVDVPEYNSSALRLFEHIGFVHEGTLRQSRPHEGSRFDSVVMGMLAAEYEALDENDSSTQAAG